MECTAQFWIENTMLINLGQIDPYELILKNCSFKGNCITTQGSEWNFGANRYLAIVKVHWKIIFLKKNLQKMAEVLYHYELIINTY